MQTPKNWNSDVWFLARLTLTAASCISKYSGQKFVPKKFEQSCCRIRAPGAITSTGNIAAVPAVSTDKGWSGFHDWTAVDCRVGILRSAAWGNEKCEIYSIRHIHWSFLIFPRRLHYLKRINTGGIILASNKATWHVY